MKSRIPAVFAAATLLGCGPVAPTDKAGSEATSTMDRQRIININQSDLAICHVKPPALSEAINAEVLIGLLVASRPYVMECLVDPKNRGAEKDTRVTVKTTASASGFQHQATGPNLTPDGQKCISEAIGRWFAATPVPGGKVGVPVPDAATLAKEPLTAEAQFQHVAGVSPTVKLGNNEGSDIAGTVRLMQSTWCDCYAEWKDAPPRPLKAKIKLVKAPAAEGAKPAGPQTVKPAAVTFEPTNDPTADKVAACLQKKVSDLSFKESSDELTIPYTFLFVHSSYAGPLPDAPAEIQFAQLDAIRGLRAAETVIAVGGRTAAAVTYDGLVQQYKAKPASVPVEDLKTKCAALLKTDDGWVAAMERQLEADQKALALVVELKAKDDQWAKAEAAVKSNVDATQKDLDAAKKTRTDDAGICPKERF